MCVCNTYKGRGCWTDPGQGLGAEPGGWGALGGYTAGWLRGGLELGQAGYLKML